MLLAFTDESYSDAHYYQAALIIDERDLAVLDQIIKDARQYVRGFGVTQEVEFHGNEIMSARNGWEPLQGNFGQKSVVFKYVLRKLTEVNANLIIEGIDIKRLRSRYKYPDSPSVVTHKHLMDSIDRYAEMHNMRIEIIADQIEMQAKLEALFQNYQSKSTGGFQPRKLLQIEGVTYVESHLHSGVQLVDLCVFLYRRLDEHVERSDKTRREVIAMWEIIQPLIHPNFPPRVWRP